MARRNLQQKRAVVTGASSGIGREIARELVHCGSRVLAMARRRQRLEQMQRELDLPSSEFAIWAGDVTNPGDRTAVLELAQSLFGGLDILVNNAGVSAHGRFLEGRPGRLRRIMEVNFFAVADFIRDAAPLLRAGNESLVVNIGSVLGERAIPHTSEYCASKFALHGLSEALRIELATLGIGLLVVAPASTQTELNERLIEKVSSRPWKERRGDSPTAIARATVRAIQAGRDMIIPSWNGWLFVTASRLLPGVVDRVLARYG